MTDRIFVCRCEDARALLRSLRDRLGNERLARVLEDLATVTEAVRKPH